MKNDNNFMAPQEFYSQWMTSKSLSDDQLEGKSGASCCSDFGSWSAHKHCCSKNVLVDHRVDVGSFTDCVGKLLA